MRVLPLRPQPMRQLEPKKSLPKFDEKNASVQLVCVPGAQTPKKNVSRVLIVENEGFVAQALAAAWRGSGVEVLGIATTIAQAKALLIAKTVEPDTISLDVNLPDGLGFDLMETAEACGVETVVVCSNDSTNDTRSRLKSYPRLGAYIDKNQLSAPNAFSHLVAELRAGALRINLPPFVGNFAPRDQLSTKQYEVARFLGAGATTREVADWTGVSESAIRKDRARIAEVLGVDSAYIATELEKQGIVRRPYDFDIVERRRQKPVGRS